MRIALGSLTYPLPNGVTNSVNLTVDGLLAAGHEVIIIAPEYDLGRVRPEHVTVPSSTIGKIFMSLWSKEERMFSLRSAKPLEAVLSDFKPDIYWLHQVTWAPNLFEKVMMASGKPTVLSYHTLVEQYARIWAGTVGAGAVGAERFVERSRTLANEVNQVITPSQVIKDKLHGYGVTSPISVIPTGISPAGTPNTKAALASKYNFDASLPLLLFVGRISEEKNIIGLLQMAALLKKKQSPFTLLMIGPGDIEETRKKADELGVGENVMLTDALPADVTRSCYGAADLFVFASQSETQGLVIGEAMMAGLPVVAMNSPIQAEIYPTTVARVVTDPAGMAAAIEELMANPDEREKLSVAGKDFVQTNFSIEMMRNKQLEVLTHLVATHQAVS